jgi:hypothetical protein
MEPSDGLYELIHALSKGEKKIVKLAMKHNQAAHYERLFDIYTAIIPFDERKLKKMISASPVKKYFPVVKKRLYQFILKSIRTQYPGDQKVFEVRELLEFADILIDKNLRSEALKLLQKARELAEKYDFWDEQRLVLIKQMELSSDTLEETMHSESAQEIGQTIRFLNNMIGILDEYEELIQISKTILLQKFRLGDEGTKKNLEYLRNKLNQLNRKYTKVTNVQIKIKRNALLSAIYFIDNNLPLSIKYRKKTLTLLENNPSKILDNPVEWLYHTKMYLASMQIGSRLLEVESEIAKIERFTERLTESHKNRKLDLVIYAIVAMVKLNAYMQQGVFEKGISVIELFQKKYIKSIHKIDFNNRQVLLYNFFYIYFGLGEYHTALKWLNLLINGNFGKIRQDIQSYARIANILLHYELGNFDLIGSLCQSTRRFTDARVGVKPFFNSFLQFAQTNLQWPLLKKQATEFLVVLKQLPTHEHQEFFDFEAWLESKISGNSFKEIIRLKYVSHHTA